MLRNQEGFTLPEILIGLAISSIIIAASFASYIVIKQNYDFQKDMKNISQTSRAVATMIMRDVRMAGYNYDDGPSKQKPAITNPVTITDGGSSDPDRIEIIYDKSYTERLKISYYTKTYNNRLRVYKKVEKCNAMNCAQSSLQTIIAESPIADYVEDLQFVGTKGSCSSGDIKWGCGSVGWVSPLSVSAKCENALPNPGSLTSSGKASNVIDGDRSTVYSCFDQNPLSNNGIGPGSINLGNGGLLIFKFANKMRLISAEVTFATNIDGGSSNSSSTAMNWTYPYAEKRTFEQSLLFLADDVGCVFNPSAHSKCERQPKHQLTTTWWDGTTGANSHQQDFLNTGKDYTIDYQVFDRLAVSVKNTERLCDYNSASPKKCISSKRSQYYSLADIKFYGEVYGGSMNPQEVEIALLIRSPEEHGTNPISQSFNIGNRVINTNDNYIRDSYSISALIRNSYYGQ
ncbi:prepilin-type N-terminal cleavage/methylation domain-containing protein [Pelagibacteraceae bacterium]|nr:prepilin-type N-terminal cleavage/methylation domain-containing protein [Pelagibacteraceae bacterium]